MPHTALLRACAVLPLLAATAAAQPPLEVPATPTPAPAIERCAAFCATFFAAGSRERSECVAGCADGDACTRLCDERFPDDRGKHTSCYKRCMAGKAT